MDALKNPSIYLSGLRIDEPVTTVTDVVVALVGIIAFFNTRSSKNVLYINLYRWFFLITGISTLVSAFMGHAFNYRFDAGSKIYGWVLGILSVAFAQFAAIYHAKSSIKQNTFSFLMILNTVEVLAALILTFILHTFITVEIHSAFGLLLIVTTLEAVNYSKTKSILSKLFMYGVGFCVIAVTCHVAKLAISPWFNHLDISHVFMAIALFIMYTGLKKEQALSFT